MHIMGATQQIEECFVRVNVFDGAADDQGNICVAEPAESVASFLEGPNSSFDLGEHFVCIALVRPQLCAEDVGLGLL